MNDDTHDPTAPEKAPVKRRGKVGVTQEDRLKAALKANMARRKAQAKARMGDEKEKSQGQ